jgi:hypothetical protein
VVITLTTLVVKIVRPESVIPVVPASEELDVLNVVRVVVKLDEFFAVLHPTLVL